MSNGKLTSIKVSRFTLDEINMRKGFMEYSLGKKFTINTALIEMCKMFDESFGARPPKTKLY